MRPAGLLLWRRLVMWGLALAWALGTLAPLGALARESSGIRGIPVTSLPPEARETLRLIKAGGPFPYARDGVFFQNRERRLPPQPRNYYREYTVPTPGSRDRGARRIIAGQRAEYYYTSDHYRSFSRIVE